MDWSITQWQSQSINQSIKNISQLPNQSIKQSSNQSKNHSVTKLINQSIKQSINQQTFLNTNGAMMLFAFISMCWRDTIFRTFLALNIKMTNHFHVHSLGSFISSCKSSWTWTHANLWQKNCQGLNHVNIAGFITSWHYRPKILGSEHHQSWNNSCYHTLKRLLIKLTQCFWF